MWLAKIMKMPLMLHVYNLTPPPPPTNFYRNNLSCWTNTVFSAKIKNWHQNGLGHTKFYAYKVIVMSNYN